MNLIQDWKGAAAAPFGAVQAINILGKAVFYSKQLKAEGELVEHSMERAG